VWHRLNSTRKTPHKKFKLGAQSIHYADDNVPTLIKKSIDEFSNFFRI
jgi:hypothetical protein